MRVRYDIPAKQYNRKILRNSIRAWAERKGYKPSETVRRKWLEWRFSEKNITKYMKDPNAVEE